ncbi:unnamed protein product [Dibothriocephalus latus]|uniref:Uncharacterized protein n=1 Tax=Dibothriocephalus latus TaxID=60516 RepID=A0A3P7LJG6_DIBLA|nr:unnamed protein product [Dibothriocephalus latus]
MLSRLATQGDGKGSSKLSSLKTFVYGAAEKILGFPQCHRSNWINGRSLRPSTQANKAKSRNYFSFHQLQKLTAKRAGHDRQKYWSETATFMEQSSNVGDTQILCQTTR